MMVIITTIIKQYWVWNSMESCRVSLLCFHSTQCYICHHTPFSFQLQEAGRQATILVESHCSQPNQMHTQCISIVWGWHMHARGHAHCRMVNTAFLCISPLGWLRPTDERLAKDKHWVCLMPSVHQLHGSVITHTSIIYMHPHWDQCSLLGGTSHQLDSKARITRQEAPRCSCPQNRSRRCKKLWKLLPCFLVLSFSTGQFSSLVFLRMYPHCPALTAFSMMWDVLWVCCRAAMGGWNRMAGEVNKSCEGSESIHKSTSRCARWKCSGMGQKRVHKHVLLK